MQNMEDGWYCKKEYRDKNGDWHTEISDYMSKAKAEKICNDWNNSHSILDGDCSCHYSNDFDLEDGGISK